MQLDLRFSGKQRRLLDINEVTDDLEADLPPKFVPNRHLSLCDSSNVSVKISESRLKHIETQYIPLCYNKVNLDRNIPDS